MESIPLGHHNSTVAILPEITLEPMKVVKLLWSKIVSHLNNDEHVSVLCSKASRQINVSARFPKTLDLNEKLQIIQPRILSC